MIKECFLALLLLSSTAAGVVPLDSYENYSDCFYVKSDPIGPIEDLAITTFDVTLCYGSNFAGLNIASYLDIYVDLYDPDYRYPDDNMAGTSMTIPSSNSDKSTLYSANFTFENTLFTNPNYDSTWRYNLFLEISFHVYKATSFVGQDTYDETFKFVAQATGIGHGVYEVSPNDLTFYPVDQYFDFTDQQENHTEYLDFSSVKAFLCRNEYHEYTEDKYYSIDIVPLSTEYLLSTTEAASANAYIVVSDPNKCFPNIKKTNGYFKLPLKGSASTRTFGGVTSIRVNFSSNFSYYVNPHTLDMAEEPLEGYEQTKDFYYPVGKCEEIKESCSFYFVAESLGYNKATYYMKLDFEGDHEFFGDCLDSDYCLVGGRG